MENEKGFYNGVSLSSVSAWTCTNMLRWKKVQKIKFDIDLEYELELQQMWQSNQGEQRWEPVKIVD